MSRMKRAPLVVLAALVAGCVSAVPPPGWQQGGAPLLVARATWNAGATSVEIAQNGHVFVNDREVFTVDGAGRVFDADSQPIALLRRDGRLVGSGNEDWGAVGPTSAAAPGARYASLAIAPSGQVLQLEDNGDTEPAGAWFGCGLYAQSLQTCMLVTYLVSTRFRPLEPINRYRTSPFGTPLSPGLGVGIPIP
jgi:hypothetical protein